MGKFTFFGSSIVCRLLISLLMFSLSEKVIAQSSKLRIADFVVFSGNSVSPEKGVHINSAVTVSSGYIGSYSLIQTTGSAVLGGGLHTASRVLLTNSNTVHGDISAANSSELGGNAVQIGSNAALSGNINVNGNILIEGGKIDGTITHPSGTTYSGPVPAGSEIIALPALPELPAMPAINQFENAGTNHVINLKMVSPGRFGRLNLTGKKTIIFAEPGTYIFSEIKNSGSTNNFVFDFQKNPRGVFRIYVHGDIDLNKVSTTLINGGTAAQIYTETHGTGSTSVSGKDAFNITNGSSGSSESKWAGMVWAPYASINIGSGTGGSDLNGSLWSNFRITLQSGVHIAFTPFIQCDPPVANAGPDKMLDCSLNSVILNGSSSIPSGEFSWQGSDGGVIASGNDSLAPTVTAAGTYVLTVKLPGGCLAIDTVKVSFDPCIIPATPPSPGGKEQRIIGSELNSLFLNFGTDNDLSDNVFLLSNDSVYVEVISKIGQYSVLLNTLQGSNYGLTDIIDNVPNSLIITGKFPIANLRMLDLLPELIEYVRPLFPPVSSNGIAYTKGDISMRSDFMRNGFNLSGEGVKIGVLSDSYNTISGNPAQTDVANGDLPGLGNPLRSLPVQILKDYPFGRRSDEGRAMLQIIHDIAPRANLAFRTGFISAGDFANGIKLLQQADCDIIVDDITYITEPFYQDGIVAKAVNEVTGLGVSYFTAAGNYGNKSYQNTFNPIAAPSGLAGTAHNFGGGDIYQNISLTPGFYTIVLQWEDDFYSLGQTTTGTTNDMDIYLADNNGTTLFGFNRNNIGGDPLEILSFNATLNTTTNLLITRAAGSGGVNFKYIIFRGEPIINEHNLGNSTIVGQANAAGALTVGAVLYTNSPAFNGVPSMASFSSIGGTRVNGELRNKPDFAAPNGVNTTVNLRGEDIDDDGFPNFFGTSAAAPHAAAAAALLIEAANKFSGANLNSEQLRTLMSASAFDIGPAGYDPVSGKGFIQPNLSLRTFASPTPYISELVLPDTSFVPGKEVFTLTVKGEFLDASSRIYYRDQALPTTFLSSTSLQASIPAFGSGNPPIYVHTPPSSVLLNDGGNSDTLFFFSSVKKNITIIADNKVKRYGEKLPEFTATVLVDSIPLQNTIYTLQSLGLDSIQFSTPANSLSNVNSYIIRPSIGLLNQSEPIDIALLESNNYIFTTGVLSIKRLPLRISPRDTTFIYGSRIGDFAFNYEYDDTAIALNDRNAFSLSLTEAYYENLADAVALVDAKAIVNGRSLTNEDLDSLSFLVSSKALINARAVVNAKAIINNQPSTTNIVDVALESIFNYQTDPDNASLVSAKAIVNSKALINARSLINGTATVNARSLINASPLVNSSSIDSSGNEVVVIVDSLDFAAPPQEALTDFKAITLVTGISAGNFMIVPGALLSSNFEISYGLAEMTILPAPLNVKASDELIFEGSPLPEFKSVITGYQFDDSLYLESGPSYHLEPVFAGEPGIYSIVPHDLFFNPSNHGYSIRYFSGVLYVNPKGPGARKLKPSLNCVEELRNHPSGFRYVAHFVCENPNSTAVYVPVGPDNIIKTSGSYSGDQPRLFLPGITRFDIYFDGSKMTWTVRSYEVNQQASVASIASSTSSRCTSPDISSSQLFASGSSGVFNTNNGVATGNSGNVVEISEAEVYPNPVNDLVIIRWKQISDRGILITDINGKVFKPDGIRRLSPDSIELDLSGFKAGLYLIKVQGKEQTKFLRIIRL